MLAEEETNTKALFRRGKARAELGQTDAAKEDFEKARKLAPDDKAVTRELRAIAQQEKELYEKQKVMYKGLFKAPKSPAAIMPTHWYSRLWQWLLTLFHFVSRFHRPKKD